jgi:hypothetical protein
MLPKKYMGPIRNLGGSAIIVLVVGVVLPQILQIFLNERQMEGVLVNALPFLGVFIAIILLFILSVFMVVIRFSGNLPYRTHRPVEVITIFGIFTGIFFLFQPWQLVGYQYSFMWLLVSTLMFIMWSHVSPKSGRVEQEYPTYSSYFWAVGGVSIAIVGLFISIELSAYLLFIAVMVYLIITYVPPVRTSTDNDLPAMTVKHQLVGAVAGFIIAAIVAGTLLNMTAPVEPYGYSQRQWERGLREEQKQEIIAEANITYRNFSVPFSIFMSLFPAGVVFFMTREVATSMEREKVQEVAQPSSVASVSGS